MTNYQQILPEDRSSLRAHLEELCRSLPLFRFEERVLAYVEALLDCGQKPILIQLERGKLDNLSEDETAKLLAFTGLR